MSVDAALPLARRRLRWRARRGLLENDVIITRFLDRHGDELTLDQIASFEALLNLPENELLDLLLARVDVSDAFEVPEVRTLLHRLRAV
ncbi:MAG TPA: succinate dehydrogenase assembly factor 2 [Burkholderiaceae bacterium]|nr:succinate dehydrogenase assembly factor 2 [Burkholderiaceae bacterium]